MADLLRTIRAEIDGRLRELAPAIAEYEQLSTAAEALAAEGRAVSSLAQPTVPRPAAPVRPAAKERAPAKRVPTKRAPAKRTPAKRAPTKGAPTKPAPRARGRERAVQSPADQAILAALEHGSHTVAELVLVTALPAGGIRDSLRHLRASRAIVKTDRDGRSAYALPAPAA